MLRRSASLCSFPLVRVRRLGIIMFLCKSQSFLLHARQSHYDSSSSTTYFAEGLQFYNSILKANTVDAFGDIYKEMLRREPLPPAADFVLLFKSAVKMRYYVAVISFIRDYLHSSSVAEEESDLKIMNILINCLCLLKHTDLGFLTPGYMFKIGLKPNAVTLTTLIDGLYGEGKVDQAIKLSQNMETRDYPYPPDIRRAILGGFDEFGHTWFVPDEAALNQNLCSETITSKASIGIEPPQPNLVTYNCLLEGLCNSGRCDEASILLIFMLHITSRNGNTIFMPDAASFNMLAHALSQQGMISGVKVIMALMIRTGLQPDKVIFTALIYGYCSQNRMNEALQALNLMVESGCSPDIVTHNSLIQGFCKTKNIHRAADLIREMVHSKSKVLPDMVTWNTFIHGCFRTGKYLQSAMQIHLRLSKYYGQQAHNPHTCNIVLDCLFQQSLGDRATGILKYFELGNLNLNLVSYSIMLRGMCDAARFNVARQVIHSFLPAKGLKMDLYSYTIMIKGLCNAGRVDEAEDLLMNMEQNGCLPNRITYNVWIQRLLLSVRDISRTVKYLEIMKGKGFSASHRTIELLIEKICHRYGY